MDYKDTLNLPNTPFPMKASLAEREPPRLARWEADHLYATVRQHRADHHTYVLHDGPPYANAPIHLGTALNKILKDVVVKSKTLSGFDAPYIPGWDCHGLPIELHVEKKVGKAGDKLTAREFRQACRAFATEQVAIQKADFKRLGVFADWDNPYLTMNFKYEADEVRALAKIIAKGHLERGQKPVHWCTACGSALAEAEVEYQDKVSPAIDVAFDVIDVADLLKRFAITHAISKISVPIWTTTPWTLPANQAVALNPTIDYALVDYVVDGNKKQLVLADALVPSVMTRYGVTDYSVIAKTQGAALEGLLLQHPFLERRVPIILGDHVTTEAGTGNVHTAPAHGIDDYKVGQKYQLPQECPVNAQSCFVEGTPIVSGLHVFKANQPIIDALLASGHLLHLAELNHSYPHCWRHKKPLIFRATPQWFVSMEKNGLREMALKTIDDTTWLPGWGKNRIHAMMDSRPDWCISRQRSWGVPITLFIHQDTSELHPKTAELMEQVALLIEQDGIDAWYDLDPKTLLGADAENYIKVTDTLDVWFDSGVSHYAVLEKRLSVPADLYLEGSDQHRGWFQTSLLTSVAMRDIAPFKTVLTHGYVVDGKGHKMSKSIGNTIAPQDIISKYGADVLRLWAISADYTGDVKVSDDIFKQCSDAYRRIRNTARFLLSNLADFNPEADLLHSNEMAELDAWMIMETHKKQMLIEEAYEQFNFQNVYQLLLSFCSIDLGSFYLDVIKDRLYTAKATSKARRSAQTAMHHILEAMVRWLAPVISFTADEIWDYMPGKREPGALFYSDWYAFNGCVYAGKINWELIKTVRNEVNKVLEKQRQEGKIGSALDAEITLYAKDSYYDSLHALGSELRFALITSGAHVERFENAPANAENTAIEKLGIVVIKSTHAKCERCWQHREDVGHDSNHPTICGRCVVNVIGEGEQREFA